MSKQYLIRLSILALAAAMVFTLVLGSFNPVLALLVIVIVVGGGVAVDLLRVGRKKTPTS